MQTIQLHLFTHSHNWGINHITFLLWCLHPGLLCWTQTRLFISHLIFSYLYYFSPRKGSLYHRCLLKSFGVFKRSSNTTSLIFLIEKSPNAGIAAFLSHCVEHIALHGDIERLGCCRLLWINEWSWGPVSSLAASATVELKTGHTTDTEGSSSPRAAK